MVQQGLPYGSRPRLLMLYLCTRAKELNSPVVPIADSMTGFMKDLGIPATGGATGSIIRFKEQMNRLTAMRMQFAMDYGNRSTQFNPAPMISRANLWFPDDPRQRVMWPSEVRLSDEFFADLRDRGAWIGRESQVGWERNLPISDGDTALALQSEQGPAPQDPEAAASSDELGRV